MIRQKLIDKFGSDILQHSSIRTAEGEKSFRKILDYAVNSLLIMDGEKFNHCVEIGTYKGVSAAVLSEYCKFVYTFDNKSHPIRDNVWNYLDIKNIFSIVGTLYAGDFDIAYIDGNHSYESVSADIKAVEHCGKIIFHDYAEYFPSVMRAVDELRKRRRGRFLVISPFAYWESM